MSSPNSKTKSSSCKICGDQAYRLLDKVIAMCIRCKNAYYAYWKKLVDYFSQQSNGKVSVLTAEQYTQWMVSFFNIKNCKFVKHSDKMNKHSSKGFQICKELCAKCRFHVWLFQRIDSKYIPASIVTKIRTQHPFFYSNYSTILKDAKKQLLKFPETSGQISDSDSMQNLKIQSLSPKIYVSGSSNGIVVLNKLIKGVISNYNISKIFRNKIDVQEPIKILQIETSLLSLSGHFPKDALRKNIKDYGHLVKENNNEKLKFDNLQVAETQNDSLIDLTNMNKYFAEFRDASNNVLHNIVNFILVETWKEVIPGQKLEGENLVKCSEYSKKIAERSEYILGATRFLASHDGVDSFRCAPDGKFAVAETALYEKF